MKSRRKRRLNTSELKGEIKELEEKIEKSGKRRDVRGDERKGEEDRG